jgi:hypothetical protein
MLNNNRMRHDVHELLVKVRVAYMKVFAMNLTLHEYIIHVFVVYSLAFFPHYGFGAHLSKVGAGVSQVGY